MENMMLFIGIDLGTSAVKLLLMDEEGQIKKTVSREYPLSFPQPGWAEQDPEDWYEKTMEAMEELLSGVDRAQVRGISFGGQMHGLVILDEDDKVIRPAILWNDGRTTEEVSYLNDEFGRDKLLELTGNIAFAGFTAPKILWLQKHEPENFKKIAKIMLPKDYLAYRISDVFSTDVSDAAGMLLLNVRERKWSQEMLSLCGINEEMLPTLYESYEKIGSLKSDIAERFGLSADVVIAAGAGDNAAAAIGTGTVGDGRCNVSLGTSGTIFISTDTYSKDEKGALHSFCHADGSYHLMGCMLSAASCNKWWMDEIIRTKDYPGEQKEIRSLGENHVYFLPYLMGERSPHNDPLARGTFIGMTMDTTREDMTQAVLEGVAFGVRDMLEASKAMGITPPQVSRICGGGAKSPLWRRIMANVLNMPMEVPLCEEGPGMGGAMLAMVAAGAYDSVEDAVEAIVKVSDTVEPEPELAAKYEERYQNFKKIYPALKEVFMICN